MTASQVAVLVIAAFFVVAGVAALLLVIGSAKAAGPDTDQRDPYGLAGRESDAPALDLDLALARDAGVDATPDGSHDDDRSMTAERWAQEMALIEMAWQAGDISDGPPVVLGREPKPGRPEGMCRYRNP